MLTQWLPSIFVVLVFPFVISACSSSNNKPPLRGQFVDSPVSGIAYTTATQSGLTDSEGYFTFKEGEEVTFSLGELTLGTVMGQPEVTLFELSGAEPTIGNEAISSDLFHNTNYKKTANIAILLQTFDFDGNPDNGIEITAQVAALFTSEVPIDLTMIYVIFRQDKNVRTLLNTANSQTLLSNHRQVRPLAYVMEHLYSQRNLLGTRRRTSEVEDSNADGITDAITTYTFNERGHKIRTDSDSDADGIIDRIEHFTYDEHAQLTRYTSDFDADGVLDDNHIYTYDIDGNQIRKEIDTDADGINNSIDHYEYDVYGNMTRSEEDNNADGIADRISIHSYDSAGNPQRLEIDNNGDGLIDEITINSYDSNNDMTRSEADDNADGIVDTITHFEYNNHGNVSRIETDQNNDGSLEFIVIFEFNSNGQVQRVLTDSDGDGSANNITTYEFNSSGQETGRTTDNDADGINDIIDIYSYDINGNRASFERDNNGDGIINDRWTFNYSPLNGWAYFF